MNKLTAPFTPEQVKNLRAWQACGWVHPFTCCDHQTMMVETDGFHCPKCGGVQTWCHDFMANGSFHLTGPRDLLLRPPLTRNPKL